MGIEISLLELAAVLRISVLCIVVFIISIIIIINLPKIESGFIQLCQLIVSPFKRGKKEIIRLRIQDGINSTIDGIDDEVPGLFSFSARVKWINNEEGFANIKKGSILIKAEFEHDEDKAYLKSVNYIMDRCLLFNARRYLHGHILTGAQLVLTERFIQNSSFPSSLALFRKDYYDPALEKSVDIRKTVNTMELLDHQGLFTRIFLRECNQLADKLGKSHESTRPKWDVTKFLQYMNKLIKSLSDDSIDVDFEFSSKTIQSAFAVLANPVRLSEYGMHFYKHRTRLSIERGAKSIYILALGGRNILLGRKIVKWLEEQNFIKSFLSSNYNINMWGQELPAICIYANVNLGSSISVKEEYTKIDSKILVDSPEVFDKLSTYVPEIAEGKVQIIKSGWIKNDQILIIVNSIDDKIKPVGACVGRNAERVKRIEKAFSTKVHFAEWDNDLKIYLQNCLDYEVEQKISKILINPLLDLVTISVLSQNSLYEYSMRNLSLVRITEKILGYELSFELDWKNHFRTMLNRIIPETRGESVFIEELAFIPGHLLKIQLSSKTIPDIAKHCIKYIHEIRSRLELSEKVYFCEKCDTIDDTIKSALYPADPQMISDIKIIGKIIYITIADERSSKLAVGSEGSNIRAAEEIIGYQIIVQ